MNRDAQKHYQNDGQPKIYGGNAIRKKYILIFFSENSYSFRCLQSDGEFIPDPRPAATEKARLPKLSFVLGTISCCEIDALSCLGIFERCRILGRYGGCCIV